VNGRPGDAPAWRTGRPWPGRQAFARSRRSEVSLGSWIVVTLPSSSSAARKPYLVITRMLGWDLDESENWLVTTSARLSAPA